MANIQQKPMGELLGELGLSNASEEDKQKAVEIISIRFQEVIMMTLLKNLDEGQRKEFSWALKDPAKVEQKVAEISAQVPGLDIAIQDALLHEFEVIKMAMKA